MSEHIEHIDVASRVPDHKRKHDLCSMYPIRAAMVPLAKIINPHPPINNSGRFNELKENFKKLLTSVKKDGIFNPLIGIADMDGNITVTVGYSRAWAAKEANVEFVPFLINDVHNKYTGEIEIMNTDHARTFFKDQPYKMMITKHGITSSEPLVNNKTWWGE